MLSREWITDITDMNLGTNAERTAKHDHSPGLAAEFMAEKVGGSIANLSGRSRAAKDPCSARATAATGHELGDREAQGATGGGDARPTVLVARGRLVRKLRGL